MKYKINLEDISNDNNIEEEDNIPVFIVKPGLLEDRLREVGAVLPSGVNVVDIICL